MFIFQALPNAATKQQLRRVDVSLHGVIIVQIVDNRSIRTTQVSLKLLHLRDGVRYVYFNIKFCPY